MKENRSLELSFQAKELLNKDLSGIFFEMFPFEKLAQLKLSGKRDRIYNTENTILTMILTMTQQDKSLQNSVNLYSVIHSRNQKRIESLELEELQRIESNKQTNKVGRPRKIFIKIQKSKKKDISKDTSGFSQARQRLGQQAVDLVFNESKDFTDIQYSNTWHGRRVFITDGTYLQMQDTVEIKDKFACPSTNSYPRGLLQVFIEQGSGCVYDFRLDSDSKSELLLFASMIENVPSNSLILADDYYNSFALFSLLKKKGIDIIVPGKRKRNYKHIKTIGKGDELVEIKNSRDTMLSNLYDVTDKTMIMRRISYKNFDAKEKDIVIYTSILDEEISKEEIILKYGNRWDIEIGIREAKTIMDINIIRSKTPDMAYKELTIAMTSYNYIRQIIAKVAEKGDFSPQGDIFQEFYKDSSSILVDKLGRKYSTWSPGRGGYNNKFNQTSQNPEKTK
jgi:hypothetical protein